MSGARVDTKEALVYLEGRHTKSDKRRPISLDRPAREALVGRAQFLVKLGPNSSRVFCIEKGVRITTAHRGFATARRQSRWPKRPMAPTRVLAR